MVAVDLSAYWDAHPVSDEAQAAIRLMQWANYVKRKINWLDAKGEMLMLEVDEKTMGRADWWKTP